MKEYLIQHPQYFSSKNKTEIENISTGQQYYFICDNGHEFKALPANAMRTGHMGCPYCTGRSVLRGFNDIWTKDPVIGEYLFDKNDGFLYTANSNKILKWKCPDCGAEFYKPVNKMHINLIKCQACNKLVSYGEKFIQNLLEQLCVAYEKEYQPDWSNGKRYDFYLPEHNCIIEVHGRQHYIESGLFSRVKGGLYNEQQNDEYKYELAKKHGIDEYIIIPSLKRTVEEMRANIMCSLLPTILDFEKDDINWEECHCFCMTNVEQEICNFYDTKSKNLDDICAEFHLSKNTVREYLKNGTSVGICSYSPKEAKERSMEKCVESMLKRCCKPILQIDANTGNIIREFPSIQEAQRIVKTYKICDCAKGKRNTSGGYIWKYKNEYVASVNEKVIKGEY